MPRPALVITSGPERVAGEVEVVLVELREIARGGPYLHKVHGVPWAAKRNRWLVEEKLDVQRDVRLARSALFRLLDEPDDRCVPLRELCLVAEGG